MFLLGYLMLQMLPRIWENHTRCFVLIFIFGATPAPILALLRISGFFVILILNFASSTHIIQGVYLKQENYGRTFRTIELRNQLDLTDLFNHMSSLNDFCVTQVVSISYHISQLICVSSIFSAFWRLRRAFSSRFLPIFGQVWWEVPRWLAHGRPCCLVYM